MRLAGGPRWREARPLALALLAAVLLHALWLAEARLRLSRQRPPERLQRADNTPELLVFSRQPPEPLGLDTVPLPPPSAMPPPPPDLPELGVRSRASTAPPAAGRSSHRPAVRSAGQPAPRAKPAAASGNGRSGRSPTGPRRPAPPPLPPLPAAAPLEALMEARRRGPEAVAPLAGEAQQRWRSLWLSAETGPPAPAALAGRPEEAELRRLPLARARAEGLDPESGRPLRLDDHWLLPWIEGDQLWLLRSPL